MNVLVVGAGIAGLTAALRAHALGHDVELVVKGALGGGCTPHAQGGIAGVYGPGDSPALHALDTLHAGAGHGDAVAIAALVDGATAAVDGLVAAGVPFDLDASGQLARGLEAAHSRPRIAHAGGDATGRVIFEALIARIADSGVRVRERAFAVDVIVRDGRACGIRLLGGEEIPADAVVLATGGAGQLYARTTNPAGSTGDGIAMALRAGAAVADLEFVQFHPTVLVPTVLAEGEPFLVSEAVRGAGAVLRDAAGRRFMLDEHPDGELAPRDVVARAVARRAAEQGSPVVLDATSLGATELRRRFPTIDAELRRRGADWSRTAVPITPAAHYLMGGVVTDIDGRTCIPGLWAVGETARTGVHGANRLASNSLLEGAVFAARVADSLTRPSLPYEFVSPGAASGDTNSYGRGQAGGFSREALQALMWERVGLLRDDAGLESALQTLASWRASESRTAAEQEDANLLLVARATASAALARRDSLGAHHRTTAATTPAADRPALIGAA